MSLDEYDRDTLAYLRGVGVKDALLERVERALADGARLRAERDAVLALHQPEGGCDPKVCGVRGCSWAPSCGTCSDDYPCPTARAMGVDPLAVTT